MRFKKTISIALALVGLLLSLTACLNAPERQIQRTQLVMFKSLSFYMPEKSFEEVFGKADEVVEEEESVIPEEFHFLSDKITLQDD